MDRQTDRQHCEKLEIEMRNARHCKTSVDDGKSQFPRRASPRRQWWWLSENAVEKDVMKIRFSVPFSLGTRLC